MKVSVGILFYSEHRMSTHSALPIHPVYVDTEPLTCNESCSNRSVH